MLGIIRYIVAINVIVLLCGLFVHVIVGVVAAARQIHTTIKIPEFKLYSHFRTQTIL